MSLYIKCMTCGEIFNESDIAHHPEWQTRDYYEVYACCPYCRSDELVEAVECERCGELHAEEELHDGLCSDCMQELKNKYKHDIEGCIEVNDGDTTAVEINSVFAKMFTAEQIDEILHRELTSANKLHTVDLTPFIESWNFCENANYIEQHKLRED